MKLAVLADIHGNYRALETVLNHLEHWHPDKVVVAGDIVNRGPRSPECLACIQSKQQSEGWQVVRGNHEDYVIDYARPETSPVDIQREIFGIAEWTWQQLHHDVTGLQTLPFTIAFPGPDSRPVQVTHASLLGNRNGIFRDTAADSLRQKIGQDNGSAPALFCVGHTHLPLIRHIDDTLVVNVGSVGLPFDGDHRAAYGQITWRDDHWSAEIIRLEYDRSAAEQDFIDTGFLPNGGPIARLVLDELRSAKSRLYQWMAEYQAAVLGGHISVEAAVNRFLRDRYGKIV
jgi:predicted phosphodiesterase